MSSAARSPGAFFASAALHALLMVLIGWFTWQGSRPDEEQQKVFELVAGEGDNFAALEAPALGTPGIKVEIPDAPAPSPQVAEPAQPESPVMVAESPVERTPPTVKTPAKPVEPKQVNLAKMVDRVADRQAAKVEKKFRKEQAAAEAQAAKEAEANAKRMTKEEFDRLNKGKTTPAQKTGGGTPLAAKRIDTAGIAGGVKGGSTANTKGGAGGTALTREDIELSDAYISLLIQRLKEAHQKPEGLSDLLQATVKFRLTASGAVTSVTILSSSRNAEFDQSVLAAFRRITLPSPPAKLKTSDYTITFKMREDA